MLKNFIILALIALLAACGGGGSDGSGSVNNGFDPGKSEQTVTAEELNAAIAENSGQLELSEGSSTTIEGDLALTSNQSLVVKGDLIIK
ncbi:hypothetical protein [Agarivorans sp. Alg241-V36]|uniref:hypothetical protein n=1 Tax=Agarivorans sp. Alg241-V36 TaxID=2305992 RepID=UPI0013D12EA6|nr:hypothetical protein [Agarivorans sp. Alg241-V36]